MAPIGPNRFASPPTNPSLSIGPSSPKLPDPFHYRIPRGTFSITFSRYKDELPSFDDVIDMLDDAELDLEREIKSQIRDKPIEKRRGWNLGTAHLVVFNPNGAHGLDHRTLIRFLWGLRESGMEFGFWTCEMEFRDDGYMYDEYLRGLGTLGLAEGPRKDGRG